MQYATDRFQRTVPASGLCPGFSQKGPIRLEVEIEEETQIRSIEEQIGKARREGTPVESLIEGRRQIYESWLKRLERELDEAKAEEDKKGIKKERERAIQNYKW